VAKRKSSSGFSTRRKRWLWFLAITLVVVVIIAYETGQEMRRQEADARRAGEQGGEAAATPAVPPEKAQAAVRSYYRTHAFPPSWIVGKIELAPPGRIEVSIYFSPRIGSPRHGRGAPPGDITPANACPLDADLLGLIESFSLQILVNDKTGVIDRISC
jgi:hypothetical protein